MNFKFIISSISLIIYSFVLLAQSNNVSGNDTTIEKYFNKDSTLNKEDFFIGNKMVASKNYRYYNRCKGCLKKIESYYIKGILMLFEGPQIDYFKNGRIKYFSLYSKNRLNGLSTGYYEDGTIAFKYPYVNNQLNGVLESFYPNGNKDCVCEYMNGKKDGLQNRFFSNGQLYVKMIYEKGRLIKVMELYDKNGIKLDVGLYRKKTKWYKQ